MYRIAHHLSLRTVLALIMCAALLPLPGFFTAISETAHAQSEFGLQRGKPRPGKPEGVFPNLEEIKNESDLEREAPPPIPSTVRAKRNEGKPWDGRRVGDPQLLGTLEQRSNKTNGIRTASNFRQQQTRRAHARAPRFSPSPVPDDQFLPNFFTYALARSAYSNETSYWYDHLRVAYAQGQESLKLAAIEFGRTLFESAEYAARNRSDYWYVYDLYKTYLMREPDSGGWATWQATVATHGREYVRRGFEDSTEFANLVAGMTPNGTYTTAAASLISARVDRRNQPGNGMLTRDASWSVPLLSVRGRAGLDLGLTLSYSSMVWTRSGPYIYFDEDNGFPSPGFRLGFPTVQRKVFDAQTARNAYLLITAAGRRIELRQVGTSSVYDAADSSYLRLTENGSLVVQSTDGTRLNFTYFNGEYRCTEVKDRNGNYITVNYNSLGQITTITDTLGRVITFNYDGNANLLSITQAWNGQPSHQWVSFGWGTRTMQYSFSDSNLRGVIGTANGATLPVVTQVTLNDTSHFTFDYSNSLQMSVARNYFGALERNSTTFTYETPTGDAPRLQDSRVSAHNWSGYNNVPSQVITQYSVAGDGACVMTAPDGTIYKEYYGTGWQQGLTTQSEVWSGGVRKTWTTTAWTQDDTTLSYAKNPRPYDINIYDELNNRRRTETIYTSYNLPAPVALPTEVKEYAANGTTILRRTAITYFDGGQPYIDRRVLGLLREVIVYDGSNQPQSKVWYDYDWSNEYWEATPQAATQHDASGVPAGRGNLCWIGRWDVSDINNFDKSTRSYLRYNRTGSLIKTEDHYGHGNTFSYTDSFSDLQNRNTFAYPTTITDADGFSSYKQYNYDFGATTRTQGPPPAGQSQGVIQTLTYNSLGQLERITTSNNNAYKRFWYGAEFTASYATVNNVSDELYSIQVTDGLGRVIGAAGNHPGSSGTYRLVNTVYDQMGRVWLQSNPTEVNNAWVPSGDDSAGIYYTQQTYDWKGRPLVTTNTDLTTREASYSGCGCAGGEVVTLTDEGTIEAGVAKRRQQRIYSDVLGRTVKSEILNWQGGSVYSTTVNTYNARNQVELIRVYAGTEASGTYQDTTMTYDGFGRLRTRHVPQQSPGTATTWDYFADDTVQKITDARNATQNFTYNNRHLPATISYTAPSGSGIVVPATTTFAYDAAGNRTSMSDGLGTVNYYYDQMSRMTSETRHFTELTAYPGAGNFTLTYQYNLADALTSLALPSQWGGTVSYAYDTAGRLTNLTGTGLGTITQFVTGIQYRAWGAAKYAAYGDNSTLNVTYNNRLLTTRYELSNMKPTSAPATIMGSQNQYYADGMVKYTQDLQNGNFDRGYEYDHVGRIQEALSGREARGLQVLSYPDNPFRQSYTYDVWDNMKRPFNRHWSANMPDTPTYTNNRRSDATYDAEGNVLLRDYERKQHAYDAAGRQRYFLQQEWGLPNYAYEANTIDITFDGDGRPAKRFTNRYTEDYEEVPWNEPSTIYYVRSTVLGGAAIVEYMPVGYGTSLNVYVGDQKILDRSPDSGYMQWRHVNPVTGSWLQTFPSAGSATTYRSELDPLSTDVGTSDPYITYTSYPEIMGLDSLYEERGNPFDPSGGCGTIDGMPASCSEISKRLRGGSLVAEYEGRQRDPSQSPFDPRPPRYIPIQRPIEDLGLGWYRVWVPAGRSRNESQRAGYLYFMARQKSEPTEMDKLIARAEQLRNQPNRNDCKALVELLKYAGELFEDVGAAVNALGKVIGGGSGLDLGLRRIAGAVTGRAEAPQPRVGGFGSHGFLGPFRDFGSSPNQVRHAMGAIVTGMVRGTESGLGTMNANETDPTGDGAADVRLNQVAVPLGGDLNSHVSAYGGFKTEFGRKRMDQLAKDVDEKICDPNVK